MDAQMDLMPPPIVVTLPSRPLGAGQFKHCSERDVAASYTGGGGRRGLLATLLPPLCSFFRQLLLLVMLTLICLSTKEAVGTCPRMCHATCSQGGSIRATEA